MNYISYFRNRSRLLSIVKTLLDMYQRDAPTSLFSCKEDIFESVKETIDYWKSDVAEWKDSNTDYYLIAHNMIIQHINSALYSGGLNLKVEMNRPQYRHILKQCVKWAYDHGQLTEEEYKEYFPL